MYTTCITNFSRYSSIDLIIHTVRTGCTKGNFNHDRRWADLTGLPKLCDVVDRSTPQLKLQFGATLEYLTLTAQFLWYFVFESNRLTQAFPCRADIALSISFRACLCAEYTYAHEYLSMDMGFGFGYRYHQIRCVSINLGNVVKTRTPCRAIRGSY